MSRLDREKWDQKHRARDVVVGSAAEAVAWIPPPPRPNALALDLGCGAGRNVSSVVARGYRVVAADVSGVALTRVRQASARAGASVLPVHMDVDAWAFAPESFDLVVQIHFLDRKSLATTQDAVRPGGWYLLATFAGDADPSRPGPRSTEHRLRPGELATFFKGWQVLRLEEDGGPDGRAAILAAKQTIASRTR